jgi:hypothetical protein
LTAESKLRIIIVAIDLNGGEQNFLEKQIGPLGSAMTETGNRVKPVKAFSAMLRGLYFYG